MQLRSDSMKYVVNEFFDGNYEKAVSTKMEIFLEYVYQTLYLTVYVALRE